MLKSVFEGLANGQIIEVSWEVANKSSSTTGHNVVSQFALPTEGLAYVSSTPEAGTYNSTLHKWIVDTLYPKSKKSLSVKYRIDDITLLNFAITQDVTLTETDSILENNHRVVYIVKAGEQKCDPCNFITPAITISDDNLYEIVDIGANDTLDCPCCTKKWYYVEGSATNVSVISIPDGKANIIRADLRQDAYFDYYAVCEKCIDGQDYSSVVTATVKINKLHTGPSLLYKAILDQAGVVAPTVQVNYNTLGGTVVWTRASAGRYIGTLANKFIALNTHCYATLAAGSGAKKVDFSFTSINTVELTIYDTQLNAYADLDAGDVSLTIEVFQPLIVPLPSPTRSPSITPSISPSLSVSNSITPSETVTPTVTPSLSESSSVTPSETVSPTVTPSISVSNTITPTPSLTPSETVSVTITPTPSLTPTITVSNTPTPST